MKNATNLRQFSTLRKRSLLRKSAAAISGDAKRVSTQTLPPKGSSLHKKKRAQKDTTSTLKKKLWKIVSEYVRRSENGVCFTCGLQKPWKEMQAGHFLPKSLGSALYFEKNNIHCQCFRCNINLGGNGAVYYHKMRSLYGEEEVNRLFALKTRVVKLDYPALIEQWSEKVIGFEKE